MKKAKSLILLLIVLVLVIAGYIIAAVIAEKEEEKNAVPEETQIVLFSGDTKTVTALSYQGKDAGYSLEKENDVWYLAGDHAFPLNQTAAASMASAVSEVSSSRKVTESRDSFGEYGLDSPEYTVTASFGEQEYTLYIGDYNKANKMYYANLKGSDAVYVISGDILTSFDTTVKDLIVNEKLTLPTDGFDAVTLADFTFRDGTGYSYLREEGTEAVTDESGSETTPAAPDTFKKILSDGTTEEGDFTDVFTEQYDFLTSLDFSDWVVYAATEEDLASYGLAEPFCCVNITYSETVTLSADDNSTSTTTVVPKNFGVLIGDTVSGKDEETDDEPAADQDPAGETETDQGSGTGTETTDNGQPAPQENEDDFRYVMIAGGRIIYKVPTADAAGILGIG